MRRMRRLLLAGIALIVLLVGATYHFRKTVQEGSAPPPPQTLAPHLNTASRDWVYTHTAGGCPVVEVRAAEMEQLREPSQFDLKGVRLRLFHKCGEEHDLVTSQQAGFDPAEGSLYSAGDVEITLALKEDGPPRERLMKIRSSGVRFDAKSGLATTDEAASFKFDRGEGRAVGATYDPQARYLRLHRQVELNWTGQGPQAKVMRIETEELTYREEHSSVHLGPSARLTRGSLTLEAGPSVVTLEEGYIRKVEAQKARGSDSYPGRKIEYAARHLTMNFTPKGLVESMVGDGDARLEAHSATARTLLLTDRVDLEFDASGTDSTLKKAWANGRGLLESSPIPREGVALPETRVLKSETIELAMRAGGEEIDSVSTHSPGEVEFLPNRAEQRRRRMEGDRMWIHYGERNRIRSFRAVGVRTYTENRSRQGQAQPPALTRSQDLQADFDPGTSQLTKLEQWGGFRYSEGKSHAVADRAVRIEPDGLMRLEGSARVWDEQGSTAADCIRLDEKTGVLTADGRVSSSRTPDSRPTPSGGMLSTSEPYQAKAQRMVSSDNHLKIVYEGDALIWQGSNRLKARRIEIDRKARRLNAEGDVVSQWMEEAPQQGQAPRRSVPVLTVVRAPGMTYLDAERRATYRSGAKLTRAGMDVDAREVRAFFVPAPEGQGGGNRLDYAEAEGSVVIVHAEKDRTRRAVAEQAEYRLEEERIVLHGGRPRLDDSLRGSTTGERLTYFARDDRLLVDGVEKRPAVSRINRQ